MNDKEICWNITARCNQKCRYCHRFLGIKDLSFEENKSVLEKIIDQNVTDITWTGGEALLLDYVDDLLRISSSNKVRNKLITNGQLLTNERIDRIGKYLDSITLSLDTTDDNINERLGRGYNHYKRVKEILDYLQSKYPNIKIRINSVICNYTKNVDELIKFLNDYNIYSWRIFKFMPLRELAEKNKNEFSISKEEYDNIVKRIKQASNIKNIDTRIESDMEKKYILILADGSIIVTENGTDKKLGNALNDSLEGLL